MQLLTRATKGLKLSRFLWQQHIGTTSSGYKVFVAERGEKDMEEKNIERKLVQAVKAAGGIAPKFTSPGFDGMPDRLVLLPNGRVAFVEVKQHGEKPRPLQKARHEMLRRLGFQVYVLDDGEQIGGILNEIQST